MTNLFEQNESESRGLNYSYNEAGYIWKYLGVDNATARVASENDQNYLIYRLADVYLMKAEALIIMKWRASL